MKTKKIILYSETFKGYLRIYEIKQGKKVTGLELKFSSNKNEATTFPTQYDKNTFINSYCIGVNYQFKEELI